MSHIAASPAVGPPRSRLLAGVAASTVVLYVAASPAYLVGSLTAGDLWMLVALAAALLSDAATRAVLRILRSPYGVLAGLLTGAMVVAALRASNVVAAVSFVGQLSFTLWLVIPVVVAGIAELLDPFRFLRWCGVAYLLFYAVGLVLLFGFGSEAILYQSSIGRVFQRFTTQVFQMSLMALGMAGAAFGRRRVEDLALLCLSLIPILFNANRTGLVSFAALAMLTGLGAAHSGRRLLIVMVGLVLAAGVGIALVKSPVVQDLWGIRVLNASSFLEDEIRLASVRASLAAIRQSPLTLLFGAGWGSSGGEIVVHNLVIQVTHEGGLFVLLGLSALFALPVAWVLGARSGDRMARQFVVMLMAVFVLYWMLNAVVVERPYWLTYAVALGVAYRLRLGRAPAVPRVAAADDGMARAPAPA